MSMISIFFTNGTGEDTYPGDYFKPDMTISISASGSVSVSGSLVNGGDFFYGNPNKFQPTADLRVNDVVKSVVDIDTNNNYAASLASSVTVAANDKVSLRIKRPAQLVAPYDQKSWWMQDLVLTATLDTSTTFSPTSNSQPAPSWTANMGWIGGTGKFRWVMKFTDDDGATVDMKIETALAPGSDESDSSFDPSSTSGQTHTALFDKGDVTDGFELHLTLPSATGTPRQVSRLLWKFLDEDKVPTLSGTLPTDKKFDGIKHSGVQRVNAYT